MTKEDGAARRLKVAAVQAVSRNGAFQANLSRAEALVVEAAGQGAELVLCPEFLAAGYVYAPSLWRSAEPRGGLTEAWLGRLARAHGLYIGASYLEIEGRDFYNTFALMAPGGRLAGRVRKESLPAYEGWFFRSDSGPKWIDTELGRIGVGICQDNHTARFLGRMVAARPDLLLMPHSGPCIGGLRPVSAMMREGFTETPPFYARSLGVPVVLTNKAAASSAETPIPGLPLLKLSLEFPGLSSIHDGDGERVAGPLEGEEGLVVGEVTLDPRRKRQAGPEVPSGYFARPPSVLPRLGGAYFEVMERLSKAAYATSLARRRAALP